MHSLHRVAYTCVIGVSLAVVSGLASAQQKFPTKPIRIVVNTSPGATPDILARLIGVKMSDHWGQSVVIDNRLPAVVANALVAKAAPDGYTLLQTSASIAIRAAMFTNLPYDTLKDFAGVSEIGNSNTVVVTSPTFGVKSVKELIAYASARPGKIYFATPAAGGADHMNIERFRLAAGIKASQLGQAAAPLVHDIPAEPNEVPVLA